MLNYRVIGKGSPLLLCHGFGISFTIWEELIPLLREHLQLVAVELPGFGASPLPVEGRSYLGAAVEELESLRIALNIPQWSILGYSSGSRVAEAYIQTYPSRTERAIFLCPAYVTNTRARGLRIAINMDGIFPSLGTWILAESRLRFLICLLAFNLQNDTRINSWYSEISSQPLEMLKETIRSIPKGGSTRFTVPSQVPAYFIWGKRDWITHNPGLPSSQDVIIPANHSAPQTSPEAVANCIRSFMEVG